MFLAARISYICFFTAVHIYDFHISTIINSWSVLWPIRTKECIKQATIGSRKWLNRSKWIQPRTARTTVLPFPIISLPSFPFFSIFCSWRKIDLTLPERSPVPTKVTNPWFSSIISKFNGIQFKYILNQRITSKAHSDWLLKLRISFAINLWATRAGFVPKNIVIVTRTIELKSSFCAISSYRFGI